MNAFVLILAFAGHQKVFLGADERAARFATFEQCAAVAKAERERLVSLLRGAFILTCTPANGVIGDDE